MSGIRADDAERRVVRESGRKGEIVGVVRVAFPGVLAGCGVA